MSKEEYVNMEFLIDRTLGDGRVVKKGDLVSVPISLSKLYMAGGFAKLCTDPKKEVKIEVEPIKEDKPEAEDKPKEGEKKHKKDKKASHKEEAKKISDDINKSADLRKNHVVLTRRGQVEAFYKLQPFYYDRSKIFYFWDREKCRWVISDEVDFCNAIFEDQTLDTIDSKTKNELIEAFKQVGRSHKPKNPEKTWIQCKDKVFNIKTGETFEATPDYFFMNPIPWVIGESEETPTISKLFSEWVDNPRKLEEVTAYSITPDRFLQRLISNVGGGSNGKSSYMKILIKLIGEENYVVSDLKALAEDKFEPAVLHGKLVCGIGEVSYDDLKNTNVLKKVAGEDKISFQFKGHTPFTADNTALPICNTNSLATTPDKTIGFYRKWYIIDFPHQFKSIKGDIVGSIPEIEFSNLLKKSLRILKELYEQQAFTDEGDFDERIKRYEERSNPVMQFIKYYCEENDGAMIPLREFATFCNDYLRNNHLRVMTSKQIGNVLRNEGFMVGNRKINGISACVIINLSLKNELIGKKNVLKTIETIETIQNQTSLHTRKTNMKVDSFRSFDSFLDEKVRTNQENDNFYNKRENKNDDKEPKSDENLGEKGDLTQEEAKILEDFE